MHFWKNAPLTLEISPGCRDRQPENTSCGCNPVRQAHVKHPVLVPSLLRSMPVKFKFRFTLKTLVAAGLAGLLLAVALHQPPPRQPQSAPVETRGVWITNIATSGLHHVTFLDEALHEISKHQINTLYPNVWSRGQTLYPSRVVPSHLTVGDSLQNLIHHSKRQQLRVIPWFEYGLKLTDDSQLARQHPDWLSRNQTGKIHLNPQPPAQGLPPLPQLKRMLNAVDHVVMNPAHPLVQDLIVNMLVDLVERYDVAGIQLDDHFAWPVEFGYDTYTRKLFQADMGYPPPSNPRDSAWMQWRAEKLTQLMGKISRALKQTQPNLILSLSPNPPAYAYRETLQDWPTWVRRGYVDEVVLQTYRPTVAEVKAVLNDPEVLSLQRYIPIRVGLFAGPAFAAKPADQIAAQIRASRQQGYDGFVLFTWEFALGPLRKGELEKLTRAIQN
jgi:uncharacterized lipoprotein YddW (UPF0748 family)